MGSATMVIVWEADSFTICTVTYRIHVVLLPVLSSVKGDIIQDNDRLVVVL